MPVESIITGIGLGCALCTLLLAINMRDHW